MTHRYRHRPTRSVISLFPGWYGGKNKGNARVEQNPGWNPVLLEGRGNGERKLNHGQMLQRGHAE